MTGRWRVVFGLSLVFLVSIIAVLILSYQLVRKSLPQTNGTLKLPGLRSSVNIYRDHYGIPHILANNEEDAFYTLGFVTAQDRLWQMELARRTASGTLSEIFGKKTVETDKVFRTLGFYRIANEIVPVLSPESRIMLEYYAAGINAYITDNLHNLPLEFAILNYKPQFWRIEDSIALQRLFAWNSSPGRHYDLVFGALVEKIGIRKVLEIYPEYGSSNPVIISSFKQSSSLHTMLNQSETILKNLIPAISGSNCWVISGEKSTTGRPVLANDPHMPLNSPSVWYEIHLVAPFIDIYGLTLPGYPGIIMGHSSSFAWGVTNMMVDDVDFFIEKINPEHPDEYLSRGTWNKFDVFLDLIKIKDQPAESLFVQQTNHGPIVSLMNDTLSKKEEILAMRWTGYDATDETLGYYKLIKAMNRDEFINAIKNLKTPGQNIIYADTSDNISYWGAAAIPIRKTGNGEFPRPGWEGKYEWNGYIPFERLPQLSNPGCNYIVNANNKIYNQKHSYYISNYWEPPYRAQRIIELLQDTEKLSLEDTKKIQLDQYSRQAEKLFPYIKKVLNEIKTTNELQNYFLTTLKIWDYHSSEREVAPSIYHAFLINFIQNIFEDEMGDTLFAQFSSHPTLPIRSLDKIMQNTHSPWFDNKLTPGSEKLDDIILQSLNDAFNLLIKNHGKLIDDWRWGKVHSVSFEHALGTNKMLKRIFNIGPYLFGGDNYTVNSGEYQIKNPFTPVKGASTRQIKDLSNLLNSLSVLPTGQSGQPLDPHYKDQTELWLKGAYRSIIMDLKTIRHSDLDLLILKPR